MCEDRALARRLYGHEVAWYLARAAQRIALLADASSSVSGISCGDAIVVEHRSDGSLGLEISGCQLARASAGWMLSLSTGRSAPEMEGLVVQFFDGSLSLPSELATDTREECVALPWRALGAVLKEGRTVVEDEKSGKARTALACDACVHACTLSWGAPASSHRRGNRAFAAIRRLLHSLAEIRALRRRAQRSSWLARLGRLRLTNDERERLNSLWANCSEAEADYWYRTGVLELVAEHADTLPSAAVRTRLGHGRMRRWHQMEIAEKVCVVASEYGARPVKGWATADLYEHRDLRMFKDLDFVAPGLTEAFRFGHRLLIDEGFVLTPWSGAVCSLKLAHCGSKLVWSGHFHLHGKATGGQVEVDVSFPNLPVALMDVLPFPTERNSEFGDLLIGLAHLLKHDLPRVKDLNDLSLLVESQRIDSTTACGEAQAQGLGFRLGIALSALFRYWHGAQADRWRSELRKRQSLVERGLIAIVSRLGWPFSAVAHWTAQAVDQWLLERRRTSWLGAWRAVVRLLFGQQQEIVESDLSIRTDEAGKRIYIVPALLFLQKLDVRQLLSESMLWDDAAPGFVRIDETALFVCEMGIFLPTTDWRLAQSRRQTDNSIHSLLALMDVPLSEVATPAGLELSLRNRSSSQQQRGSPCS